MLSIDGAHFPWSARGESEETYYIMARTECADESACRDLMLSSKDEANEQIDSAQHSFQSKAITRMVSGGEGHYLRHWMKYSHL